VRRPCVERGALRCRNAVGAVLTASATPDARHASARIALQCSWAAGSKASRPGSCEP
jgi:hypothetical protein